MEQLNQKTNNKMEIHFPFVTETQIDYYNQQLSNIEGD